MTIDILLITLATIALIASLLVLGWAIYAALRIRRLIQHHEKVINDLTTVVLRHEETFNQLANGPKFFVRRVDSSSGQPVPDDNTLTGSPWWQWGDQPDDESEQTS